MNINRAGLAARCLDAGRATTIVCKDRPKMSGVKELLTLQAQLFLQPSGAYNKKPTAVLDPNKIAGDLSRRPANPSLGVQRAKLTLDERKLEMQSSYQRIQKRLQTGKEFGTMPKNNANKRKLSMVKQQYLNQQKDRMLVKHSRQEEQAQIVFSDPEDGKRKRKKRSRSKSSKKARRDDWPADDNVSKMQRLERELKILRKTVESINKHQQAAEKINQDIVQRRNSKEIEPGSPSEEEQREKRQPKPSPEKKKRDLGLQKLREERMNKHRPSHSSEDERTEARQSREESKTPDLSSNSDNEMMEVDEAISSPEPQPKIWHEQTESEDEPMEIDADQQTESRGKRRPTLDPTKKKRLEILEELKKRRQSKQKRVSTSEYESASDLEEPMVTKQPEEAEEHYETAPDKADPEQPVVVSPEIKLPSELIASDAAKVSRIAVLLDDSQHDEVAQQLQSLMGSQPAEATDEPDLVNAGKLKVEQEEPPPVEPSIHARKDVIVSSKQLDEHLQENVYSNNLRIKYIRPEIDKVDALVEDSGNFARFRMEMLARFLKDGC